MGRRMQSEGERGQVLILMVLAMALMFAIVAVVVDGSNLFVQKRSSQNGADAAALAASKDLDPYGMPCTGTCLTTVQNDALDYVKKNTPSLVTHLCANSSDANCVDVTTPYAGRNEKLKITVREKPRATFGKAVGLSSFNVTASAVAHVAPGGTPLFAFAMNSGLSTNCDGIRINGGPNTFTTIWSNGGITLSGSNTGNTAGSIVLGSAAGACPLDPSQLSGPVTNVPNRTCTGGGLSSTCYWPSPIPANPCDPSVNYGSVTVGANWTNSNPPGLYCSGTKNNDQITINGNNLDLTGYTFVAQKNDITLTASALNDTFGCTAARPCSVPGTVFYDLDGSVGLNSSTCAWTGTSQIYAPNGTITFSGGSTTTFNGVMEAQILQINGSTNFTGTGALVGNPAVLLDQ